MNRKLSFVAVILGASFLVTGCQLGSRLNAHKQPGDTGATEPAPVQTTGTGSAPDTSADQELDELQSTLQALNTGIDSIDPSQVDQSLNDLLATLQSPANGAPTVAPGDGLDQELNSLQQTLEAEPTP